MPLECIICNSSNILIDNNYINCNVCLYKKYAHKTLHIKCHFNENNLNLSQYLIFQNDQVLIDSLSYYIYINTFFDHIIIEDAIGYFTNPNYILDLIKKLLSPLGKLIIKCPIFKEPPLYNINYFNIHCMNQLCRNQSLFITEIKKSNDFNIFIIQQDPPSDFNIFDEIYNEMDTLSY
jgi:hypothetical protein